MDCPKCGKSYDSEHAVKIHYGRTHEGSISGSPTECHNCGKTFRIDTYRAERDDERHFCSKECRSESYSDKVELNCEWCGDAFKRTRSRIEGVENHYCSTECKGKSYRDRIEVECANCGDPVERSRAFIERNETTYCGNECRKRHQRGAAHPRYTGSEGFDAAIRREIGGRKWRPFRKEFHERDAPVTCEWCGDGPFDDGRRIDLHHIVPIMAGGTNTRELIMPLCVGCHRKAEAYTRKILEYPISETVAEERKRHNQQCNTNQNDATEA